MTEIEETAYAKLNISLDVSAKRADGYHDMVMIMQSVSLGDDVSISLNDSGRFSARCDLRYLPSDDRNLAVKAARAYLTKLGKNDLGAEIEIKKRVPVGAGMGGGSADAAAVLRALNRHFGGALEDGELNALAATVGSDVAFCTFGGTMLAKGRGEILQALPDMPDCRFVICKPDFSISTPELFGKLDKVSVRHHPDTAGMIAALEKGELRELCRRMYNVFEDIDDRRMRTVSDIKSALLDCGAWGSVMTGTGSAVFGVFEDAGKAEKAKEELSRLVDFRAVASPVGRLV